MMRTNRAQGRGSRREKQPRTRRRLDWRRRDLRTAREKRIVTMNCEIDLDEQLFGVHLRKDMLTLRQQLRLALRTAKAAAGRRLFASDCGMYSGTNHTVESLEPGTWRGG